MRIIPFPNTRWFPLLCPSPSDIALRFMRLSSGKTDKPVCALATFLLDMSAAPALSLQTISKPCYTLPNLFPAICFCRNKMERSTFSPRSYSSRANAISHPLTLCYTQVPAGQAAPFYVLPLQADTCQPIYLLFGPLSPSGLSAMFLLQARQVALPCVLVIPLFRLGKHRFPFLLHLDSNKTNRRIL